MSTQQEKNKQDGKPRHIKIQGNRIEDPTELEGLARLVESMTMQGCSILNSAELLFGLMVLMESVADEDKGVIIERVKYLAYINTEHGRNTVRAFSRTILKS
jgi:hypothetical protein